MKLTAQECLVKQALRFLSKAASAAPRPRSPAAAAASVLELERQRPLGCLNVFPGLCRAGTRTPGGTF